MGSHARPAVDSKSLPEPELAADWSAKDFWRWVGERQRIYDRRAAGDPPPWTADPVLATFHFCNVYRDLDRGTVWWRNVITPFRLWPEDLLWRSLVYRMVNNVEQFEVVGLASRASWRNMIWRFRQLGIKPHTPAYQILQHPHHLDNRVDRLQWQLERLDDRFDALAGDVFAAESLEAVSAVLKHVYGIGPLLAMQIYRDLILVDALPFSDDDWVEVGPGAARSLAAMYPQAVAGEYRTIIQWLRKTERARLAQLRIELPRPVSLCDIEHSLCEYGKYVRLRTAPRPHRRYYRAQ